MNLVDSTLLLNIDNPASLFVFPTNVAASRWADHLLRLRRSQGAGCGTVAMEKFIAWDTFKQNSIRSKFKNRQSIPSVLRKMFISALIRENAELCAGGKGIFSSLIRAEWAQQADSFTVWLTDILPQLGAWFKRITGLPIARIGESSAAQASKELIGDDRDLFTLAARYALFLEEYNLFEPAWETPPFEDTGKECFVFFPESLSDFNEYRDLLAASAHVKTININNTGAAYVLGFDNLSRQGSASGLAPEAEHTSDVFFYANSRSEITEAALYILALHKNQNIPWDSISVSIPEDESYGPYLLREFTNRNIPYIKQTGKPLALYPVGRFFKALADCASEDFSFSSLKELLLNQHLPWKDSDDINELIEFGITNNCISSWSEEKDGDETKINVWEDAFTHPLGGIKPQVRHFFNDLKRRVNAICRAGSFSEIRKHYFVFRGRFFDMENCMEETDIILSRCISELTYLVEIEKSFPGVRVPNPYAFFTGYLGEVNYLAQQSASGVAILPYRTAAPAPFDCHIVLGASQSGLSAVFSPLSFLPKSKREQLGITDNDASLTFIRLHQLNSRIPAAFFCSEQTFSGYAIPHSALGASALGASALNAPSQPRQQFGDDLPFFPDLYRYESIFYASLHWPVQEQAAITSPPELHANQKRGFEEWRLRRNYADHSTIPLEQTQELDQRADSEPGNGLTPNHPLLRKIRERFGNSKEFQDKFSVSSSSLAPYFQCPLLWVFSRVFKLENVAIETGLMASSIAGDVYHAVLNLFLDDLKKTGEAIAMPASSGADKRPVYTLPQSYSNLLTEKVNIVFESFPRLPGGEYQVMSMLTARLLQAEKSLFLLRLENFLAEFISRFAGSRIIATEENYTLSKDIFFLNGRIDCILENDSLVIVDFKTKYKKTEDNLIDFQLPLYIRLAEAVYKKDIKSALFFSIIDAQPAVLFETIQEKNDIMNTFDQRAEQFAQEISSGTFSFFPFFPEKCRNCNYNKVCRTLYRVYGYRTRYGYLRYGYLRYRGKNNGS